MKRILVADDEANIRLLFESMLSDEGYQVVSVGTGREALRKLLKEEFDLAIFDVKMPDMNGLELLEKIREMKKNIPVIICSAFKHLENDYIVKTGAVAGYFTKPVNVIEFKDKVNGILREAFTRTTDGK